MDNQDTSLFEEKLYQATRMPEPAAEFAATLWDQIAAIDNPQAGDAKPSQQPLLDNLWVMLSRSMSQHHRLRAGAIFALAILLVGIFLAATPAGHTLAQSIWRFFTQTPTNTLPAPTDLPLVWVEQTPGVAAATRTSFPGPAFSAECGNYLDPRCSVEQIRKMVNFPIKQLTAIPVPMVFIGATGGPDHVSISYNTQDHSGWLALEEGPWTGSSWQTPWDVGASAVVETVKIGSGSGEYVKGSFGYRAGEAEEHWDANADSQTLRWVDEGIFYQIRNYGVQLDKDTFIALSGSLTTEPVAVISPTVSGTTVPTDKPFDIKEVYPLTVAEVEKMAGYTLVLPSKLPNLLSLLGAAFDPERKTAKIFYLLNLKMGLESTNGLLLEEEKIPSSGEYVLSRFIIGDKIEKEKHAAGIVVGAFEEVQIGEITAQYVEGTWSGTDCCGWEWSADPYLKRMRWQTQGMAFELMYMGMEIEREDMIAVVGSLK